MASKKQYTYTVTVKTIGGTTVTATDTAAAKVAYAAYQQFLAGQVMEIPGNDGTTYIPYHAVDSVVVSFTSASAEYTDDTCVTE